MQEVQSQSVAVISPIRHGQSVHDSHVVSRVTVMPTVHVVAAVPVMGLMPAMPAVCLVFAVLVEIAMALGLTVVFVGTTLIRAAFAMSPLISMALVRVVPRMISGRRSALGVGGVSTFVIVRFVHGGARVTGMRRSFTVFVMTIPVLV